MSRSSLLNVQTPTLLKAVGQISCAILLVLAMHWASRHLGSTHSDLARLASTENQMVQHDVQSRLTAGLADPWRRTDHGWERLTEVRNQDTDSTRRSSRLPILQIWPAAWAACLMLCVVALATEQAK